MGILPFFSGTESDPKCLYGKKKIIFSSDSSNQDKISNYKLLLEILRENGFAYSIHFVHLC